MPKKPTQTDLSTKIDKTKDLESFISLWFELFKTTPDDEPDNKALRFKRDRLRTYRTIITEKLRTLYQRNAALLQTDEAQLLCSELRPLLSPSEQSLQLEQEHSKIIESICFFEPDYAKLMDDYWCLRQTQQAQRNHLRDIAAFIDHLDKQVQTEDKSQNKLFLQGFVEKLSTLIPAGLAAFINPDRSTRLNNMLRAERKHHKELSKALDESDKEFLDAARQTWNGSLYHSLVDQFRSMRLIGRMLSNCYDKEKVAIQTKWALLSKLAPATEQEEQKQLPESAPETKEQILAAMQEAVQQNHNLILRGSGRSVGFTSSILKKITEDDLYLDSVIEHIDALLKTPYNESYRHWKAFTTAPVRELTVHPQGGNAASMPRLYFQKAFELADGTVVNTNEKGSQAVWVGFNYGTKNTQGRARLDQVAFTTQTQSACDRGQTANTLEWTKVSIQEPTPDNALLAKMRANRGPEI